MSLKNYFLLTGLIFMIIAILHLARIILGWEAAIAGWSMPMWVSWLAVVIAGFLAYQGVKNGK